MNLLVGRAPPGNADTAQMVASRQRFLCAGHYAPLAELLASRAREALSPALAGRCILEVGAGTGYYLARVLDACGELPGIALDISKFAARRAARAHPRIAAVVADGEGPMPLATGSAAVALSVFAPRNALELYRLLSPSGTLLVATPSPRHLQELIEPLGLLHVDQRKDERLRARLSPLFERFADEPLELRLVLSRAEAADLAAMGPSAFHLPRPELEAKVARLGEATPVTASFSVSRYRPSS